MEFSINDQTAYVICSIYIQSQFYNNNFINNHLQKINTMVSQQINEYKLQGVYKILKIISDFMVISEFKTRYNHTQAQFKRPTFHVPNLMQMISKSNKQDFSHLHQIRHMRSSRTFELGNTLFFKHKNYISANETALSKYICMVVEGKSIRLHKWSAYTSSNPICYLCLTPRSFPF